MSSLAELHDLMPRRFKDAMDYDPALSDSEQLNRWCIEATHSQNLFDFCQWMTESTRDKGIEFKELSLILQVGCEIYAETGKTREFCDCLLYTSDAADE